MQVTGNNSFTDKRLSIRVATDGFSFFTPQGRQDYAVGQDASLAEQLDAALRKHLLLKTEYREVRLLSDYPATRIPLDEFRSEEAQSLYRLTFGEDSLTGLTIRYEVIPSLEVVEVFPVSSDVVETVQRHFPQATIHGWYGQLLQDTFDLCRQQEGEERTLYVNLQGHGMFVYSFAEGRLQFANSYTARETSTRQYFILYVWSQLEMDQQKDNCVLWGGDEELTGGLKKFIRNIQCV